MEGPERASDESLQSTEVEQKPLREIGRVVEVRRKLDSMPSDPEGAISAVKEWIARREGIDSRVPVEEAVRINLAARHVAVPQEILAKGWYAEPRKAGGWVVGFKFISGGQPRRAEWVVDDVRREVRPANNYAEELEWTENEDTQKSNRA